MKYYCIDQFKTLHIRSTNQGSVLVSPCCASITSPVEPDQFNFVTDPFLSRIRQNTIDDTPAPECHRCWKEETLSQTSRRQQHTNQYMKKFDIIPEMTRLDVTTQNICNLACVQCGSYSSSTWAKEEGSVGKDYSYSDKIHLFNKLPHRQLKQMHFTGGEPLMTSEHKKMLESYAQNADLSELQVSYNTNGTFYPDDDVIEIWKKLRHLNLVISIDAVGPAAEVLRWPSHWNTIVDNIKKFYKLKYSLKEHQIHINFIICVQNINLLELEDLYLFLQSIDPEIKPALQIVDSRDDDLHPASITDEIFEIVKNQLKKYSFFDVFLNNLQQVRKEKFILKDHRNAIAWLDLLEERRKTNWRSILKIARYL